MSTTCSGRIYSRSSPMADSLDQATDQSAALTPEAVQQMIQDALAAQLATLRTAGLIQTISTLASNLFVTDPYKMDFNPADK